MRWEDEPFIKVYVRDTVTWLRLEWQGQAVLTLLMRKLDRAGMLDLAGATPAEAVCALLRMPVDVVEVGLQKLFSTKTLEHANDRLIAPNYVEAQEARQSDKQRKAAERRRDRDKALPRTPRDAVGTNHTDQSHGVTRGHAESHGVTLRSDETRLDETTQKPLSADEAPPTDAIGPSSPASAESQPPPEPNQPALPLLTVQEQPPPPPPDLALQVFEHWHTVMGKNGATKFDEKRRRVVQKQLDAGRTVADLCKAIDGCRADPFSMGENDRNKPFNDLELICRDAKHVEQFMGYVDHPPARGVPRKPGFVPLTKTKERFEGYDDGDPLGLGPLMPKKPKEAQT